MNEEEPEFDEYFDPVFDERTGEKLPGKLAEAADQEELALMKKIGVYEYAPIDECIAWTGKLPVSTKWVRVNKGTAEDPDVRCRRVARDFKPRGEKD